MPIASPEKYAEMLDAAKSGKYAYPAINITSSQSINAALAGFAEAGSDGIIQVSTGGAEYASGPTIKHMVTGAVALAEYAHVVAKNYPINVVVHTDHCPKNKIEDFVRPLIAISQERVDRGLEPLFQSHMWDGSAVPMAENLIIADELLALTSKARQILEIEVGVVGGEEDGVAAEINDKLYTTVEDGMATIEKLGLGEKGRYMTALTFGNVHGVYKPGAVKLRPAVLKEIQDAVDFGVIKMNIDTDTQYAFTRPVVEHMFRNYDGVLKIDGEVGNKKQYDPRAWGKSAEAGMAKRVIEACEYLRSVGKTIG
jgi:fructose-bisphosphate aldolase, class II